MYRKILVPVDGSAHSRYTLDQAVRLAGDLGPGVTLTVLHVGSMAAFVDMSMVADIGKLLEDEGRAVLSEAETAFRGTDLVYRLEYRSGDPAETVCRMAAEDGTDLVVIGNRGGGLFAELLLGSVSHKVIQHAPCPVLVIRQPAKA